MATDDRFRTLPEALRHLEDLINDKLDKYGISVSIADRESPDDYWTAIIESHEEADGIVLMAITDEDEALNLLNSSYNGISAAEELSDLVNEFAYFNVHDEWPPGMRRSLGMHP